jgi:hypothetical protein
METINISNISNTNINNVIDLIKGLDLGQDCTQYEQIALKMHSRASESCIDEAFRLEFDSKFLAMVETNLAEAKFESFGTLVRECKNTICEIAETFDLEAWLDNMAYKPHVITVHVSLLLAFGREIKHRYEALRKTVDGDSRFKADTKAVELLGGL